MKRRAPMRAELSELRGLRVVRDLFLGSLASALVQSGSKLPKNR
jgi:hypothetical protein